MIKKIFALLLILTLTTFIPCYAEETAAPTMYILTLEDAIDMALENNQQLVACQVKKDAAETTLSVAKSEQKAAKKSPAIVNELIYVKNGYAVAASEMQIRLADAEYQQIVNRISYQVTEKYYTIKLAEQVLFIQQNGYNMAKENLDIVTSQFQMGMVSDLEVQNALIQVTRTEYARQEASRNYFLAIEDFKIALGLKGNCEFSLNDNITYEDYKPNPDAEIPVALTTRYDVMALRELAQLDELYFTITEKITAENTADYKNAKSTWLQSQYNYDTNSQLIGLSIRASANNIHTTKGNLDVATMALEVKEREYETAQLKFSMGMITNLELVKTQTELLQAQTELESAKLAYKLAVEKYQYEITYGV